MSDDESRFFSTKSPKQTWDAIVVGSGMGGMTTAALLAKLGQRVLVLEQHYVPGGFTHTFKRKRWEWDVGVHAVGEVSDRAMVGRLLSILTGGELVWDSLGKVYDEFHFPELRIDFPDNRQDFERALVEAFPEEEAAIQRYLAKVREVAGTMQRYYLSRIAPPAFAPLTDLVARDANKLLLQRTSDVLAELTSNERLKTVLTAQWGYYGATPEQSSFAIHALVAKHFWYGGFYPRGGSGKIAEGLLGTVAKAGGWTRIRADVAEIVIERGAAVGVKLANGEEIRAKRVFSAAGAIATVTRLLPLAERSRAWAQDIAALSPSPCHVCLYVGFKGDIRKAGATAANKWFYETWSSEAAYWDVEDEKSEAPVLYCSFPSLKDPNHDPGPDQLHTGEVVTFVPYDVFSGWRAARWRKRGAEYEALKKGLEERLLAQFLRHMPGLREHIAFVELSTPVSTEHFTRAPAGAIYGILPTPKRYRTSSLRPRTPVKNLFLSGSDVATVGVIGAMMGGVLSALSAEPVGVMKIVREAMKR